MSKQGKLTGIGLGPGDPELITVKGLKALQAADMVFYPATNISEGGQVSFSARILDDLNLNVPCEPLLIPMSGKNREQNYSKAFEIIEQAYNSGKNVVVVSEGDLLFYSTFGYLLEIANKKGIECELIPGIPAFIAAGSEGQQAIVEGNQQFTVIARPKSFDEIKAALIDNSTLVVMKMSVLDNWHSFLKECHRPFFYIERVGTAQQFSTSDYKDLEFRRIPYFSLILFYD
nr:precorrin-2 C(20)-methyltransferase [uncultured Draconibacterium sp.]